MYTVRAQAVVEVVSELALFAQLIDGPVCCCYYASIERELFVASYGSEKSFLENLQEFDLYLCSDLSDLVKEYRTVFTA